MLIYLENMESCLSVLPASHKDAYSYWFNFTEPMHDIVCQPGDAIMFNANLIHVGTFNKKHDNLRIQMKVTHIDDIDKISYYQDFNKVSNLDNRWPIELQKVQRSVSCTFPGISNLTQGENIRTARGSDNGVNIGWVQKMFSFIFYGETEFYDLPNIF